MKRLFFLLMIFLFSNIFVSFSQNVIISDDASHTTPSGSAVLELYSQNRGLLIPRMSTANRVAISSPQAGLMVYDTDDGSYYIYTASGWQLMQEGFWLYNSSNNVIYLADNKTKVGIGTNNPDGKFEIQGDGVLARDKALFEVKNSQGKVVFAVYENGVRVYIDTTEAKAGSPGGFAIRGMSGAKATTDYMWVTPDSIRFYIDTAAVTAGSPGGFAIKGTSGSAKALGNEEYLRVTRDSTRVYVNTSSSKAGSPGGFAIKGLSGAKGDNDTRFLHLVPENYFIGHRSGINITSGRYNTFFGYEAGMLDSTGSNNVFIGYQSGMNTTGQGDSLGQRNVFLGYQAGYNNILGTDNVLLGYQAGFETETAGNVIAIGSGAGYSNTNNSDNIFIGRNAGFYHTGDGTQNQAVNNIYIGLQAGEGSASDHNMGENNIFMGVQAGQTNTTGRNNIFLGYQASSYITTGSQNISIGNSAGLYNQTSDDNIFIGNEVAVNHMNGDRNLVIGVDAFAFPQSGEDNIIMGNYAAYGTTSGAANPRRNVIMGKDAGRLISDAEDNVIIGYEAAKGLTGDSVTGNYNVIIGKSSGQSLTDGQYNVFLGYETGLSNTTGYGNVFLGETAGRSNVYGHNNVFLGISSGYYINGNSNVFIGTSAGKGIFGAANNAYANVVIGLEAGEKITSGQYNTCLGYFAGNDVEQGDRNVFLGSWAGKNSKNTSKNIFIGHTAGYDNTSGDNNIFIGSGAGFKDTLGSNNVFIGFEAGYNETGSNKLYIDNSSSSEPLIYGDFSADQLHINGSLTFNIGSNSIQLPLNRGANGYLLATDGVGGTSWIDPSAFSNSASNGLYKSGSDIRLGGTLFENTTISQGNYSMIYNLNGNGNFEVQDNGSAALLVKNDGTVGIGTNTPATNTKLHVLLTGTPVASQYGGTIATFQQNANTNDWARVSIISGTTGSSLIDFGDASSQDVGGIRYSHSDNSMIFKTNGNEVANIDENGDLNLTAGTNGGEVHRTQTGDANMVPIAYGNIASDGSISISSGNISVSKSGTGIYDITITGENYYYSSYITNVTIVGGGALVANAASAGGNLRILIYNSSNTLTDARFSFVVYKP